MLRNVLQWAEANTQSAGIESSLLHRDAYESIGPAAEKIIKEQ
jgi:hypothetical protein